ncbi:bifunctional acetaldehyde-CoA/alcohol dehydrogenase, partial [Klebsiella pneumoniae]|nr:bifunctional acetaldehyde-CoA/alcohol dehydrogenase [Klebsiella pneumoniae]
KTFDNGMICASEQAIIVDKEIYDSVKAEMMENSCYFVTEEEREKLEKLVINENTCAVNSDIVGKSAQYIAELVGITVPADTKMLVAEI